MDPRKLRCTLRTLGLLFVLCLPGLTAKVDDSIPKEMISAHNFYRGKIGTPPLAWSEDLATRAREWATKLIDSGMFVPRRDGLFGENLFEITGGNANPYQVVTAWMSEAVNYNHVTNSCTARCGHYTQVVWRSTSSVGCGVARSAVREVWVCDYAPHGNTIGEWPY